MGLTLPDAPAAVANYVPTVKTGNLLFISGQISKSATAEVIGQLGANLSTEQGVAAARICALNILAQAKTALGTLDLVEQVVRLNGFVSAAPSFTEHAQVINGASDLIADAFGAKGRHTRAAVGVASLPLGCAVEIDAILAVKES